MKEIHFNRSDILKSKGNLEIPLMTIQENREEIAAELVVSINEYVRNEEREV